MNQDKIVLRSYRPGDEFAITSLFYSGDPRHPRSVHYWHWSNDQNCLQDYLSVVAEIPSGIIGHYSLAGYKIKFGGDVKRVGFGQQAIIHKDYRNLKTILELSKLIFRLATDRYDFIYGFPNDHMFPVNLKIMDWQRVEVFHADVIRTNNISQLDRYDYKVDILQSFPPDVDSIISHNIKGIDFIKNAAFLNWRFFMHPINHYTVIGVYDRHNCIAGYMVLKLYFDAEQQKMLGHFIDYEAVHHEALAALVNASASFFKFHHAEEIIFWNKNKCYEDFFREYVEKNERGFKTNFGILQLNDHHGVPCMDMNQWSLSMAFSDAF